MGGGGAGLPPFQGPALVHYTLRTPPRLWFAGSWTLLAADRWGGAGSDLAADSVSSLAGTRDGGPNSSFLSATPVLTAADPEILGMGGEGEKGVNIV